MTDSVRDEPPAGQRRAQSGAPSLVVGIGASAGGIGALSSFFTHVPENAPIAYVVILHLSPDHDSKLAEVLQGSTSLPVSQVRGTTPLEARHIYVIPPNQSLKVVNGSFRLSPMTRFEERRAPVDIFFRTLANAYGARAAAVILSGTGANGSNGLKRVKEEGGLTIAQSPEEAEYGDMPSNAIATGLVDFVLSTSEMPDRIRRYYDRLPAGSLRGAPEFVVADDAGAMREIITLLRVRTAHDFSNYKPATVKRRVERRMTLHGLSTLADYARVMRDHPDEAVSLMKELLISVTNFFRDTHAFAALEQRIVTRLFHQKTELDHVRVWSAGCATGEEAYSLAILLTEQASTLVNPPRLQVFATDLDEQAIATAREGLYTGADLADVSPERVVRFFQRETTGYRVKRELREMVLFAQHNVIKDPPFSHLDLIACRNLLIYLNRAVQDRVIETFHFALRPGGYLFLGTAESPDGDSDLFVEIEKASHVYESRTVTSRLPLPVIDRPLPLAPTVFPRLPEPRPSERIVPAELHLRLLEQFAAPSIIVTDEHTIIHMSEYAGRFLQLKGGEPTRDLLKLAHPDLRVDLRMALHMASQQRSPVEVAGVRFPGADGEVLIKIIVKPVLHDDQPPRGYFLVIFQEEGVAPPQDEAMRLTSPAQIETRRDLEDELVRVKAQLRLTIEHHETQAEEAKAANEELQAMNEELRSAAEELETSKEELQSVNEELTTVNQELKIKIEELGLTNDDFQNLINSTAIGAIFLDKTLRVKLSTPRAQEVFNLLPSDAGRKLTDITSNLLHVDLHADVAEVLEHLQVIEREVAARDGRWYFLRIVPYRTVDDRIDGAAITFLDITGRHQAERRVRAGEERLRLLIDSAIDYAIFTMTNDGKVDSWNLGAERMFGYTSEEIIGKDAAILFTPEDRAEGVPQQELQRAAQTGRAEDERWHMRRNGERFYASGVTTRLGDGQALGFAKIARDLTGHRTTEMALQEARAELEDHVTQRTGELQAEVAQHAAAREHVTMLLRKVVTAQEDQRARIARDLHDQLGQQLTALRMTLERYRDNRADSSVEDLERALRLAREIDEEVDFLAWELRPTALDDLGLTAALPRFLNEWSAHYGITTKFQTAGQVTGVLSAEAEITFYRVAQEALNNVVKHAYASRVDVLLESRDRSVVLVVEDDGIGFEPGDARVADKGIGLVGMRERAALIGATLQIESAPGEGTAVYLRCPVQAAEESPT
jgi:two-component system CheB/CheR fusion protein